MINIEEARKLWIETVYFSGKKEIPMPSKRELKKYQKISNFRLLYPALDRIYRSFCVGWVEGSETQQIKVR